MESITEASRPSAWGVEVAHVSPGQVVSCCLSGGAHCCSKTKSSIRRDEGFRVFIASEYIGKIVNLVVGIAVIVGRMLFMHFNGIAVAFCKEVFGMKSG